MSYEFFGQLNPPTLRDTPSERHCLSARLFHRIFTSRICTRVLVAELPCPSKTTNQGSTVFHQAVLLK